MKINIKKLIQPLIIVILLFLTIFLCVKLCFYQKTINTLSYQANTQKVNIKIFNFTKLFVEKVLASKEEVDFETRFKLENAIRDINDEEILNKWREFTESKNPDEVQDDVIALMQKLLDKMTVKEELNK